MRGPGGATQDRPIARVAYCAKFIYYYICGINKRSSRPSSADTRHSIDTPFLRSMELTSGVTSEWRGGGGLPADEHAANERDAYLSRDSMDIASNWGSICEI